MSFIAHADECDLTFYNCDLGQRLSFLIWAARFRRANVLKLDLADYRTAPPHEVIEPRKAQPRRNDRNEHGTHALLRCYIGAVIPQTMYAAALPALEM